MWFDGIVIGITLILAIKGFINGFVKEIAGLIGLIGGLYLASIFFHQAGIYINENIFPIKNKSTIDLVGFIAVFLVVWLSVVFFGFIIGKLLQVSGLSFFNRLLGFIVSGAKFFLLISVVLALLYKVEFIKDKVKNYAKDSILFPICVTVGEKIITLSPKDIKNLSKNVKILKN
jgi:membrane protein required for colicin V production